MQLELAGKVVVVTGGSRGIGRAIALALAAEGAKVVTCARGQEGLDAVLIELRAAGAGPHTGVVADVTTAAGAAALAAAARAHGPVRGLVNNVGGSAARNSVVTAASASAASGRSATTSDGSWISPAASSPDR